MKLSIVISAKDEELNIGPLSEQIRKSLQGIEYEVLFIDDGSTDNTVDEVISQTKISDNFKLIELRKNYGQSAAMAAGIDAAKGEFIATMDGDLQNDPSDIPRMLELIETDKWDVIAGKRVDRKDKRFLRKIPSGIANWLIRKIIKSKIEDYGCSLRVFKSDIAKNLGLYGELHRFIPVLIHLQGGKIHQIEVKHHARIHGESKYSLSRTYKVMADLILMFFMKRYLPRPMHLFGGIGLLMLFIGIVINFYLLILKLLSHDIWGKPVLILGVITLIGGIQLITIGLLAEIQIRTYFESQNKSSYTIRRIV